MLACAEWHALSFLVSTCRCNQPAGLQGVPGEVDKIRTWFRDYKTPDGKPQNKFGYDDKAMNKEFTLGVIKETSGFYQNLLSGKTENTKGLALK